MRPSVALQATVVGPRANAEPDAGTHVTGSDVGPSAAVGAVQLTVVDMPVAGTVMFAGMPEMIGPLASKASTLNVAEAVFPAASVLVQRTDVVPRPNVEPVVGEQATGSDPSTASV